MSPDDIAQLTAQRDAATAAQVAQIANETQQKLDDLQVQYKSSIQTSSKKIFKIIFNSKIILFLHEAGFGYIAGRKCIGIYNLDVKV